MRGECDDTCYRIAARVDERYRASIAVSEQNRALDSELVQQLRQYAQCLSVHVGHSSWSCKTCGLPITVSGVGEYPRAGPLGEPSREVTPHGERAQALV